MLETIGMDQNYAMPWQFLIYTSGARGLPERCRLPAGRGRNAGGMCMNGMLWKEI